MTTFSGPIRWKEKALRPWCPRRPPLGMCTFLSFGVVMMRHNCISISHSGLYLNLENIFLLRMAPVSMPLEMQRFAKNRAGGFERSSSGGRKLHAVRSLRHSEPNCKTDVWPPNKATLRQWGEGIWRRKHATLVSKSHPQLDLSLENPRPLSIYHLFFVNPILLLTEISSFGYKNNVVLFFFFFYHYHCNSDSSFFFDGLIGLSHPELILWGFKKGENIKNYEKWLCRISKDANEQI